MNVCDAVREKNWRICYLNSEHFSLTRVCFLFRFDIMVVSDMDVWYSLLLHPVFFYPLESVIPSSGTFHVKLPKKPGVELGITISCECLVLSPIQNVNTRIASLGDLAPVVHRYN